MYRCVSLIIGLLSAIPVMAGSGGTDVIVVHRCKVDYVQSSAVGTPNWGAIQDSAVKRGTRVKAGQVLANLRNGEEVAEVARCESLANSDVAIRLAAVRHKLAESRYRMTYLLHKRNATSLEQVIVDNLEEKVAAIAVEQEEAHRTIAKLTYESAVAKLRGKQIIAPHDGVVSEVFKRPGEAVQMGDQVYRIDNTARLQITCRLDVGDATRVVVGGPARARAEIGGVDLPIEHKVLSGVITHVDTRIDPTTQSCKIIVDCDNLSDYRLRAGMEAVVELDVAE